MRRLIKPKRLCQPLSRLCSIVCALMLAGVWLALPSRALAQRSTASVNGTVKDPSGAVIPGATVTLTNTDTSLKKTATTNTTGEYVLLDIPPGRYTLEVTGEGFATVTQAEFTLFVNQTATFDFIMPVGTTRQTMTIEAIASHIEAWLNSVRRLPDEKSTTCH